MLAQIDVIFRCFNYGAENSLTVFSKKVRLWGSNPVIDSSEFVLKRIIGKIRMWAGEANQRMISMLGVWKFEDEGSPPCLTLFAQIR
jgi:hypothetical protein